jgi:antitoxin VapB
MAFHVRDPKADALVRDVARGRGLGITATIRAVFEEAAAAERDKARAKGDVLLARLRPLLDRVDAMPKTDTAFGKRFSDGSRGQGDD